MPERAIFIFNFVKVMALNPNAPEFKPPFPEKPPQVSKGLDTEWDWQGMSTRGTNPVNNIPNPYSTTSVAGKGQGKKKKRNTRKTKKSKRKTRKHRK